MENKQYKVISVNVSDTKGPKKPVPNLIINSLGVEGDVHAGEWHRQISVLSTTSTEKFVNQFNKPINYGDFAENITIENLNYEDIHILDQLQIGDVILEITQIGKECHGNTCSIFNAVGNCIMPKEGLFARVIKEGTIKAGDTAIYLPKIFKTHIITLSDRASKGVYEDKSGPCIHQHLQNFFNEHKLKFKIENTIIPDDKQQLMLLIEHCKQEQYDFIFTTGGTGIGKNDITPEVIAPMLDKTIPGIMEMIRFKYGTTNPNALITRSIAGIIQASIVFALPGSRKAVDEYLAEIKQLLLHLKYMLVDLDVH